MVKTTVRSYRLSEDDHYLLGRLGEFCIRAQYSHWEANTPDNDTDAVQILNEISPMLAASEYRALMSAWSNVRLSDEESNCLNEVVEDISHRLHNRTEPY